MRPRDPQSQNRCLICLGLAIVTLALYLPVLSHSFVDYDDQQYVTDNLHVQAGLTWPGFLWAFGFHAGNWHPLAWLSHMLDCSLYGARAGGHHFTSLLFHTASTVLLFLVLNRMTKTLWRSAAVAALFAWHPLHVESVAWVAERKDVLCAFFWMLTLWGYIRYAEKPSAARYLITLGSFALCLLAKPMAVTLPFVLLLLDYWPLGRVASCQFEVKSSPASQLSTVTYQPSTIPRLFVEKIPFLLLAAAGCVLTLHAQQIAIVSTAGLTVPQRLAHTLLAYNHYFGAMFWPSHLAVYYPYVIYLAPASVVFSGLVLALVTVLAVVNGRRRPFLLVGWLWFLGTLVPVIGLVQVGDQAWADRYTYLPLVGLFMPVVWLAVEFIKNQTVLRTLAVAVGLALLTATSLQLATWKDTRTLFDHANRVTHENFMAITMLGSLLAREHKYAEAIEYYHTALRYQPAFPEAHFFLGDALDESGQTDAAIAEYQQALWFKPTQEQTHIFLGIALGKQKKYAEAIRHYEAALLLDPDSAVTHNNLARIYHTQGNFAEAITHYQAALQLDPKLSLAHNNLGILLLQKNDLPGGTLQLREALRLNPTNSETQLNLALALNQQQQWSEAAGLFAKTVGPANPDPKAHYAYATALAHTQQTRAALSEFASALLLQPDYPDALDGLAWILSTDAHPDFRNGPQAVPMAERACDLTARKDAAKLRTLAAAYAEAGRFADAIATLQAMTAADPARSAEAQRMLKQFQASQPWREN